FTLLPGQVFAAHKIDGDVHYMERLLDRLTLRRQFLQLDVVVGIEAREEVRSTLLLILGQARGTQIGANQTVAVDGMQGKLVDVDDQRQCSGKEDEGPRDF